MRGLLLLALFVLALAEPAQAAITRNSATYTKCTANPCSVSHAVAGADPFLAVCVAVWHYSSTPTITGVTWNGLPLTVQGAPANNAACGDKCTVAIYTLTNPGAATANATATFSGSILAAVVGAVSYNGVDPTFPVGTIVPSTGTGSPASVTVSSNSGEVVMDCLASLAIGAPPTSASGQTQNFSDFDNSGFIHAASAFMTGAAATVSAWTLAGSPAWAMLGLPIKPVGGGGGGGGPVTPGTQRVISWNDTSTNESCFYLRWRTDQSFPNYVDINRCLPPNTVSYAHNIGEQTGDCYSIAATNSGGSSGFTSDACAAAAPPPPPPPPPPPSSIATPFQFDFEEDLL